MMLPASRRVENAWMTLEQRGAPPAELLSADIYDSWMRCISFGPRHAAPAFARIRQLCNPAPGATALFARSWPRTRRDAHAASADRRLQFHDSPLRTRMACCST